MSDYEQHIGKVRLLTPNSNESFEDHCKRLWVENIPYHGKSEESYRDGDLFDEM